MSGIFPFAVVTGKAKGPFARGNARQCGEPLGNGQAIARKARRSERATCRAGARTGRWALPARQAPAACSERCRQSPSPRSEEHTSELQSLMRISYAVFCLKKKKNKKQH